MIDPEIFEVTMILCFGASWPINARKAWKARTAKGKSPAFLCLILTGYVAGVASYMCEWYHVGGMHLEITAMTLPMKSGLSSSAAICVMVAKAFNQ